MKKSELKQIIREEIQNALNENTKYTFSYAYWIGDDDYEFDEVTVEAPNEEKARDLAYDMARGEHQTLRTSKEKFTLKK